MKLPRVKEGDPITEGLMNRIIDVANQCSLNVGDGGSLNMSAGPDGYTLDAVLEEPIWGKTTAGISGGTYAFTEQIPAASGTWTNGTLSDVAYELNGNTTVAVGKLAKFWRTAQGEFVFNAGTC